MLLPILDKNNKSYLNLSKERNEYNMNAFEYCFRAYFAGDTLKQFAAETT